MNRTESIYSQNPFDNLKCPRCGASIPPHALFCSACGEPTTKKKEQERGRDSKGRNEDMEEQDDDVTIHLPTFSRTQVKISPSYQSLKNNGLSEQTNTSGALPQHTGSSSVKNVVGMKLAVDELPTTPMPTISKSAVTGSTSPSWGWLPALSLTSAVGVMLVALAAEAGRLALQWADPMFWLGLSVLFLPIAVRIISPKPARQERIALILILGCALYLIRDLEQPLSFAYNDEFLMWPTAQGIVASGHLLHTNPISAISPFYPGLQIATAALSTLTGLSLFVSGMIVLGVAGLVLVLGLYLFYEYLSGSTHVAAIATLLYMAKPTFFGDTLYHYEDLGIPLMAFVLFAVIRRSDTPAGHRRGLTLAIWLGIAALVVTHHVASYMLDVFLLLWTATFLLLKVKASFHQNRDQEAQAGPGWAALVGIVLSVAWLAYTGARAVNHIFPALDSTVYELVRILTREAAPRQLFRSAIGFVDPQWERLTEEAAVALISLGLPFGLLQFWRRYRANATALALAVGVLAYPASQVIRLTQSGVNIGGRLQPYLFIMVGFVLALGVTHFGLPRFPKWRYRLPLIGAIAIIFMGGWAQGTSPLWDRLPGPYLPAADQRSITPEGMTAAEWASSHLGPGQKIIGDQYSNLLMGTYGGESVVTGSGDQIIISPVFTSPQFNSDVKAILQRGEIRYIVVDRRLSSGLPLNGWYFDSYEAAYTRPINPAQLAKFDGVQNVNRIFDSGDIVIYDVEAIIAGSSTTPNPPSQPLCKAASSTGASGSYPTMARVYTGTFYDIPRDQTIKILLTGIQQSQGNICGYLSGAPVTGSFKGTITTDGHVQFIVTSKTGQGTYSFNGSLTSEGLVVGAYCNSVSGTGPCTDYGLWSLTPARPG